MTQDNRDLQSRMDAASRNLIGEDWDPEAARDQFHLYGAGKRAEVLNALDVELSEHETGDWRKYSDLIHHRQVLGSLHDRLRKVGR